MQQTMTASSTQTNRHHCNHLFQLATESQRAPAVMFDKTLT